MKYHTCNTPFVCGIDLHSKMMYICILDRNEKVLVHQKVDNQDVELFKLLLKPYMGRIVVSAESSFPYYFLADLCKEIGVPFMLGHALYMSHIHGGKVKNDRIDSKKDAELTIKNYLPYAHVCSQKTRSLRDLMRNRGKHVQKRSGLITKVKLQLYQSNLGTFDKVTNKMVKEEVLTREINDVNLKFSISTNLELILFYNKQVKEIEDHMLKQISILYNKEFKQLNAIIGFGLIIAATILLEIDDISRFKNCKAFASYCRVVKCSHESAGKKVGGTKNKIGNPHLRYIFGEAAIHLARNNKDVKSYLDKLKARHGQGKSLSILSHRTARAVYYVLKSGEAFDMKKFLQTS